MRIFAILFILSVILNVLLIGFTVANSIRQRHDLVESAKIGYALGKGFDLQNPETVFNNLKDSSTDLSLEGVYNNKHEIIVVYRCGFFPEMHLAYAVLRPGVLQMWGDGSDFPKGSKNFEIKEQK